MSQVHRSLVSAENALMVQSEQHPDGWGVAYYVEGYPHLIKSAATAVEDNLFQHLSGIVSSETVVAHLRKATVGTLSLINSHPFQFGKWIFAHNGQIPQFDQYRDNIIARISPMYRRFILGDTDSEVIFYFLLSNMAANFDIHRRSIRLEDIIDVVNDTVLQIHELTAMNCYTQGMEKEFYLSFILTNGSMMCAHQGGKELYYSTHKVRCPERDFCQSFGPSCEGPVSQGQVNHLIVSSEPLQGENIWHKMPVGQIVAVNESMQLQQFRLFHDDALSAL